MAQFGFDVISDEEKSEAEEAMEKGGMTGLKKYMDKKLNAWRKVPLNIAITGDSGAGKSTFINSFRGLEASHSEAAEVGVTETTAVVKKYPHPNHENFVLSDLPGVGTVKFPRVQYLKKVGFEKFDFFLILGSNRFTENDLWLAKEVKQQHKKFYFIRTKIDQDIKNDKDDHPTRHNETTLLERVKTDCSKQLERGGLGTGNPVFLISGKLANVTLWDFPALQDMLIDNVPDLKREALTLTLQCTSIDMIEKKVDALKRRIWGVATLSAAGGAVPIPGASAVFDLVLVTAEVEEYKHQLGLDDETLDGLSKTYHIPKDTLVGAVAMSNIPKIVTTMMAEHATETAIGFIPVLGQIVGAAMSFATTLAVLRLVLSKLREAAIKIVKLTVEASKDLEYGTGPVRKSPSTGNAAAIGDMWLWMGAVLGIAVGLTMLYAYSPLLLYVVLALPFLLAMLWFYQKA